MKVLVAYASKRGSTAEIAAAIADKLRETGLEVECREAGDVDDVPSYDAVVLGSAVYMKRWRGDAKHFLRKHSKQLAERPLWVFSSGPVGDPDQPQKPEWMEPPKIVKKVEELGAREHVVFGGRLPAEPHGPLEKAMVTGVPAEFRDRRDWDRIGSWAEAIATKLGELGGIRVSHDRLRD
ncbi:MAG TPA: flavodoxin domain-containing protein [Thermoanaerobaculia bacterium]|nr:flavodoxin domain-containing protein [Thermoanaerobaculia bacterium]